MRSSCVLALSLAACLDPIPKDTLTSPGTGVVEGTVMDYCSRAGLDGVTVVAAAEGSGATQIEITGGARAGGFRLSGLGAGRWSLTASRAGYRVSAWSVSIVADQTQPVSLFLSPEPTSIPGQVKLDVLVVVDTSGSMSQRQADLALALPAFISALRPDDVGTLKLDLHVGVVSTDMGAGAFPNCRAGGDGGRLQSRAGAGCPTVADSYISAVIGPGSSITSNVAGNKINEAFGCIAQLGTDGCAFEQPLLAVQRALDGKTNPGFLRADSVLAVVVVTDEDDCSAVDTGLFDPAVTVESFLGPLSSFRCFAAGVVCDATGQVGRWSSCAPRSGGYLLDVAAFASSLRSLRPGQLYFGAIAGPTEPVEVAREEGNLVLQPSCQSAGGTGVPAIRLAKIVELLSPDSSLDNICAVDLRPTLKHLASRILNTAVLSPCQK
jgi:hypothetical protein